MNITMAASDLESIRPLDNAERLQAYRAKVPRVIPNAFPWKWREPQRNPQCASPDSPSADRLQRESGAFVEPTFRPDRHIPLDANGLPIDKRDLPDMTEEQAEMWERLYGSPI